MDVDPWEQAALTPIDVPDYAKQRHSSDDELKKMQQQILRAITQSIEDSKKAKPVADNKLQLRNVANTNISYDTRSGEMHWNPGEVVKAADLASVLSPQPAEEVSAEDMKNLIYRLRDEWSAETGEWDGSKMPVQVLAEKITKRIRAYKRPSWEK